MKRLSDYSGIEAMELWADIFDDASKILADDEVQKSASGKGASVQTVVKTIMHKYADEVYRIISRIDDDEINGANIFPKVLIFVTELIVGDKATAFFNLPGQEISAEESSGLAMETTEGGAK